MILRTLMLAEASTSEVTVAGVGILACVMIVWIVLGYEEDGPNGPVDDNPSQ